MFSIFFKIIHRKLMESYRNPIFCLLFLRNFLLSRHQRLRHLLFSVQFYQRLYKLRFCFIQVITAYTYVYSFPTITNFVIYRFLTTFPSATFYNFILYNKIPSKSFRHYLYLLFSKFQRNSIAPRIYLVAFFSFLLRQQ